MAAEGARQVSLGKEFLSFRAVNLKAFLILEGGRTESRALEDDSGGWVHS